MLDYIRRRNLTRQNKNIEKLFVASLLVDLCMVLATRNNILRLLVWFMPLGKATVFAKIGRKVIITLSLLVEAGTLGIIFTRQGRVVEKKTKLFWRMWRHRADGE